MALTKVSAGVLNTDDLYGFRNRIINGDMRIDQRNAGASITPSTNGTMSLDRWKCGLNTALAASKYSVQQSSVAPAGFSNSVLITSTSAYTVQADDYSTFNQAIEGFNFADFGFGTANARPLALSFQIRCSLTGTFAGWIQNDAVNRSYPFTFTINAANTWEEKEIIIPGDTTGTWVGSTNGTGLLLGFNLGTGSNRHGTANTWNASNARSVSSAVNLIATNGATMYITGVQLEVGSVATPFERRPIGMELQLCQRYYTVKNGYTLSIGSRYGASLVYLSYQLPVQMRAIPTVVNSTNWSVLNTTASETSSTSTLNTVLSHIGGNVDIVINTSFNPAAYIYVVQSGSASANISFSAEL